MPRGLVDSQERDPRNFTRAQWQQAMRASQDPKAIKALFQECWAVSDSRQAFAMALEERGYYLCCGDRREFVALDFRGEVYAVAKWTGVRTKEVAAKLGDRKSLASVEQTKAAITSRMSAQVRRYIQEAEIARKREYARLAFQRADLTQRHREERQKLAAAQEARRIAENNERAARLSKGVRGIWDRLTGKHAKIRQQNEAQARDAQRRDQAQEQAMIERQMQERQALQQDISRVREMLGEEMARLNEDVAHFLKLAEPEAPELREEFHEAAQPQQDRKRPGLDRDDGMDMGI